MANIAAQRIKREFKEVIKSEEVGPPTPSNHIFKVSFQNFCCRGQINTRKSPTAAAVDYIK